jgi:hypothetical protein
MSKFGANIFWYLLLRTTYGPRQFCKILTFKVNFCMSKIIRIFLKHFFIEEYNFRRTIFIIYIFFFKLQFFKHFITKSEPLKVAQINYVSRHQLHCTANFNFGLMCKKAEYFWALSRNFSFLFSWYFFLIMFCFLLNLRKISNSSK